MITSPSAEAIKATSQNSKNINLCSAPLEIYQFQLVVSIIT